MITRHEPTSTASLSPEPRCRLLELIRGYQVTQVLYTAVSLGIAEALRPVPAAHATWRRRWEPK
jgi:hypothetical protein